MSFNVFGGAALGSAPLTSNNGKLTATVTFPAYKIGGTGTFTMFAEYSGDAVFSSAGANARLQVTAPTGGAAGIVAVGPTTVWNATDLDPNGLSWTATFTLREYAGVAAMVTGFTIDGQAQSMSTYFPAPDIKPSGTLTATVVLRNQATPWSIPSVSPAST